MNALTVNPRIDAQQRLATFRHAIIEQKLNGDEKTVKFVFSNAMKMLASRAKTAKNPNDAKEYVRAMEQVKVTYNTLRVYAY